MNICRAAGVGDVKVPKGVLKTGVVREVGPIPTYAMFTVALPCEIVMLSNPLPKTPVVENVTEPAVAGSEPRRPVASATRDDKREHRMRFGTV
jgi:hypothetical protein